MPNYSPRSWYPPNKSITRFSGVLNKFAERFIKKSQNINIVFTGENLSGKSYYALKLGKELSNKITKKPMLICFTYEKFFEYAEDPNINNVVIVFDEIGSESRSERHWEIESQNFTEILELWGMKKCILLMTLPNWRKLTGGVKGMIHFRVHCYIDSSGKDPAYHALILRKREDLMHDTDFFQSFKNVTVTKDPEIDKLYIEYYPQKKSNYNDKIAEFKERFQKVKEKRLNLPKIRQKHDWTTDPMLNK